MQALLQRLQPSRENPMSRALFTAFLFFVVACKPLQQSVSSPKSAQSPSSPIEPKLIAMNRQTSSVENATDLKKALSPGMAYADFRQELLQKGWQPVSDDNCKQNVVGDDYATQCAADSSLCLACNDLPELSSYSGDGRALVHFSKGGDLLEATALGELRDWNERGVDAGLQLSGWSISKK